MHFKFILTSLLFTFTLILTACGGGGGGGGSSSSTPPPPPETAPEQVRVSTFLPQTIYDQLRDANGALTGTITIRLTGPDGYTLERNVTVDANGHITADFGVPTDGDYDITIEVRDPTGSLIARTNLLDANTDTPTEVNVTNPIIAIPQPGQMTLIWDNLVDAPTLLIEWDPPRQITPRSRIQIASQQAGARARYTLTNLTNDEFYSFTVQARNRQAINDLATYRVGNTVGPNNDNDDRIDRLDPDDDNDGIPDFYAYANGTVTVTPYDNCRFTPNRDQNNTDGDAEGDACDRDDDNDAIPDYHANGTTYDNCRTTPNRDQNNTDGDAEGDACDSDDDNDDIPDYHANGTAYDNCRTTPNRDQQNTDQVADGGDACDDDDDNDGIADRDDNCPTDPNDDQYNNDGDALGDKCDDDDDNDGHLDRADNCRTTPNRGQNNTDGDAEGDACDTFPHNATEWADTDNDGIGDNADNCPTIANDDQSDLDNDGIGNACDPDRDGDGHNNTLPGTDITVLNANDNCPSLATDNLADLDNDNTGDACDPLTSIANAAALQNITNGIYQITADLTVTDVWIPIRDFRGTLNGSYHTITFRTSDQPLFNTIASGATVTDIGILGSTLAIRNAGSIAHAYATGNSRDHAIQDPSVVRGTEFYHSGGLVALNLGRINVSYATGNATCPTTPFTKECYSGGLVGWNQGNITNAYATGDSDATGGGCSSGGLVGFNVNIIRYAYATGESSSAGRISCHVGGLVGRIGLGSTITASYRVQSRGSAGTLQTLAQLRRASSYSGWSNTTWNFGTANDLPTLRALDGDGDGFANTVDNCPDVANPDQNNTDGDADGNACDADDDNDNRPDISDAFPTNATEWADTDGDGTGDNADNCHILANPTQANLDGDAAGDACDPLTPIASATALQAITNGIYHLTANLTVTGVWIPIRDFRGTLNGNNHTITFGNGARPLFDTIYASAHVTNIGILGNTLAYRNDGNISNAYATGDSLGDYDNYQGGGGLVAYNTGTITNSYATGNSICSDDYCYSGGLVGSNRGTITASYATGNSTGYRVGGLVGDNRGTITTSYATGKSTCVSPGVFGLCSIGGLVGWNYGNITESYATGNSICSTIISRVCNSDSGGLVGWNQGTITASYATGNSTGFRIGGLVGVNSGNITASYATGNSTCSGIADVACVSGGLVGTNYGNITASYATGNNRCTNGYGGGLAGSNSGSITASYATGSSTCSTSSYQGTSISFGGLAGSNSGSITASYRVQSSGSDGGSGDTPRTLAQLRCPTAPGQTCESATTYSGWDDAIWDFGTASDLPTIHGLVPDSDSDGINDNRDNCRLTPNRDQHNTDGDADGNACDAFPTDPTEQDDTDSDGTGDNADNCPTSYNPDQNNTDGDADGDACDAFPHDPTEHQDTDNDGIGDRADRCPRIPNALDPDAPYCQDINTAQDIITHLTANAAGYYRLTRNITILTNAVWSPIRDFRGTLNGNNHTITFTTPQPNQPLFDLINATATVTHIGIINSTLAHRNDGNISYAYATGNSMCTGNFCSSGGLVGENPGTITASYATGNSTCTGNSCFSSGLVGWNHGTITASYATGNSTCDSGRRYCFSGGLVGFNSGGTITASYATGNSNGPYSGGLVGYNHWAYSHGGNITASYATGNSMCTGNFCSSGGLVGYNFGGTITASYATGNSMCTGNSCSSGGLVGYNFGTITVSYATGTITASYATGTITASYATGNSTCSGIRCRSGGLVGYKSGTITTSYATGNSMCTGNSCSSGGLVGINFGTISASYRVQSSPTDRYGGDAPRTLAQLRCPTAAGEDCQGNATYSGWDDTIWDFGSSSQLPTLRNLPPCPTDNPACRHRITDTDNDRVADAEDNCPLIPNRDQANLDGDRLGDVCDNDIDGDGRNNMDDAFPRDATEQTDTDGDGTGDRADNCPRIPNALYPDAPYCQDLATAEDIITHLTSGDDGYYRLTDNITISAGAGWGPISDFRGTLNGNNHTITFRTPQPNQPLFDIINATATVTQIGIINSTLAHRNDGNISYAYATGNSMCTGTGCASGGLVGWNRGTITASYATGNSTCSTRNHYHCNSGGLAGHNSGNITSSSYATGNSTCSGRFCRNGGLVGYNSGTITASYATGNSACSGRFCRNGGLVGWSRGTITASYATGNNACTGVECSSGGLVGRGRNWRDTISYAYATGNSTCSGRFCRNGGLVGYSSGTITASYATGNNACTGVECSSGGLVGRNNDGTITNAYATGNNACTGVECSSGGLVGSYISNYTFTASYRVQSSGFDGGDGDTPQTLVQLREATTYTGWMTPPWDFGTDTELPRHHNQTGIPFCPGATSYSDTSCRW